MENLDSQIQNRLKKLAYKLTIPFCYSCYHEAPSGRCSDCLSDDLMRLLPGDGVEYGIDWVIEHLVRDNVEPIDVEEVFEESIRQCYPETVQVGWLELDTVQTMKDADPISWDLARNDWLENEEGEGHIVSFDHGGSHHYTHDIELYLAGQEAVSEESFDEAQMEKSSG